jgi:hypothetical protein
MCETYDVRKIRNHMTTSRRAGWSVTRVDAPAHIGRVDTRREAIAIARMLAGWRGTVTVNGRRLDARG